jgi:hypothetical protein
MNILHPKTRQPDFKNLPELPSHIRAGGSGFYLIALVESGLDLYVCFCNAERDKVYIEKSTKLNPNKFLCVEDLKLIEDDNEFSTIYKFLIDNRILNG